MRRYPVIGLAVPGRKLHHRQIRCEELQRAGELLHARAVAADDRKTDRRKADCRKADRRPAQSRRDRACEVGNDEAFRAFRHIGERQRAAGRQ